VGWLPRLVDEAVEGVCGDELHHEKKLIAVFEAIRYVRQPRVIEGGQDAGLSQKHLRRESPGLTAQAISTQLLDRHRKVFKPRIGCPNTVPMPPWPITLSSR
jgi:hypothetical protein